MNTVTSAMGTRFLNKYSTFIMAAYELMLPKYDCRICKHLFCIHAKFYKHIILSGGDELIHKQLEKHECVLNNVATDALVPKHQVLNIHSVEQIAIVCDQFQNKYGIHSEQHYKMKQKMRKNIQLSNVLLTKWRHS